MPGSLRKSGSERVPYLTRSIAHFNRPRSRAREAGYRYLVVSRKRKREFDAESAERIATASGQALYLDRRVDADSGEVRLHCYSEARAHKERAMVDRLCARYEVALTKLHEGLSRPRARRKPEQIHERIGRLKAKHRRVSGYYCADGRTLHLRKATRIEPHQQPIYHALGIHAEAGAVVQQVI